MEHSRKKGDALESQLSTLEALGRAPNSSPSKAVKAMGALASTALRMGLNALAQRAVESAKKVLQQRLPGDNKLASDLNQLSVQVGLALEVQRVSTVQRNISTVPSVSVTTVARAGLLAKIHASLAGHPDQVVIRQAAVRALGGYGKTVTAILYAHQYADHYPGGRFFLPVESGDLVTALASLTMPLGLPSANDPKADAKLVSQTLREGEPSLLILDNVANRAAWDAMLGSGLVPRGGCRVLITTRDDAIGPADEIKVGRLEPAEAREVYRLFCEQRRDMEPDAAKRAALPAALPTDAVADEITAWLGGLAVAVAAVAAYMKLKPDLAWDAYWNGDGKQLRGLKNTPVSELPDVTPEVAAQLGIEGGVLEAHRRTNRVIDDAIDSLPAPERRAVEYASLLPKDNVPAVWLESLLEADATRGTEQHKLLLEAKPDNPESAARAALRRLDQLGAIAPADEDGKILAIHPLWRALLQCRLEADTVLVSRLWASIAACVSARRAVIIGTYPDGTERGVSNPAALTDESLRWELTPLAETCKAMWAARQIGPAARVGVWVASVLQDLGRFSEALACLPLSDETDAAVAAEIGNADLAAAYSNLSLIQQDQGDLPGARASMEKAIAIQSKHFAPDHPTFATRYSNLATIQKAQGDLPGARASMERAIAIESQHFAPDHPTFATRYSNLATIQQDQGDLPGARASLEKAIAIAEKHLGADHPNLATMRSNLAMIQKDQGDLPGARASMEKAIAIDSKHFAPDHPTFATRYNNLALILQDLGDFAEALRYKRLSMEIERKHLGEDHPQMGASYSNLATVQYNQGDLPGARASMERSIAIASKHFAPDHPTFATRYNNLAHICYHEGDRAGACANFTKALAILLKHFGEDHPHVKSVRGSMKAAGCGA